MKRSPVARISLGLVFVTCSILVTLDLLGLTPVHESPEVELRARMCEQLAAQTAASVEGNDMRPVRLAMQVAVSRNDDVLSAAVRSSRGRLLVSAGDHRMLWSTDPEQQTRGTHLSVPIFKGGKRWGALEMRFADPDSGSLLENLWARPVIRLVLAVAVTCFAAFVFYLKRTLKHLDPSSVIPTRVQVALDVMAEGVLLLDDQERIVLANAAFAGWVDVSSASLLGAPASGFDWRIAESAEPATRLPWTESIRESKACARAPILLVMPNEDPRSLMVNVAPVLDGWDRAKGAIATFDDVTELELRGASLEVALKQLQESQEEIRLHNEELQVLARRDPLTGVANRRAFLEAFEQSFDTAKRDQLELSCVMADIDHFKQVNDGHGHAAGDAVIKNVVQALQGAVPSVEQVCRYGGEEFCVMLIGTSVQEAFRVAEKLRQKIEAPGFARVPITVSFGVSAIESGARTPSELINQADEALYVSKHSGRNQVTRWKATQES